jgi:cephalosporin-C deacetylase
MSYIILTLQPIMKNTSIFFFLLPFLCFTTVLNAQFLLQTDSPTGRYAVGDTAFFVIRSGSDAVISYAIKYAISSDLPPLKTGQLQLDSGRFAFVSYVVTTPGFVHFSATQKAETYYVGATFDPYKIEPIEPESNNFDAFWTAQKALLAALPLRVNVQRKDTSDFAFKFSFDIELTDGKRVYGYMNIPRGNGYYPAIIRLPAFGNAANLVNDDVTMAERGGVISIYLNIHNNLPTLNGPDNYLAINTDNPNNFYLKYAILGVIKTIDYLQTRPDFNGQVGVVGISQGGGLALLAAGIDPRISLLVDAYPALCAHPNLKYNKPSGFPSYWRLAQSTGLEPNTVLNTVKYYDAVTAAKRFKGVSWTMLSYLDDICNAATIYEAFNQLKGEKLLTTLLSKGHVDAPDEFAKPDFSVGMYAFIRRHFSAANNAPTAWLNTTIGYSIDAGKDTILNENRPIILKGSIFLENSTTNLPLRWEKIEGAGTVTFSNPQSLTTTATFSQSGIYRLRLIAEDVSTIASDKKYTRLSDDIMVTIYPIIPVELVDFTGKITKNGNELNWSTASERNNKSFELERSADALNWQLIAQLAGKGSSNALNRYQFTDKEPLNLAYYRLKQIDVNGVFNYSKTISLIAIKDEAIDVFPNPVFNVLTIKSNENSAPFDIKIYDVLGKIWSTKTSITNELTVNTAHLTAGPYFIEIKIKELTVIKKFIKSKSE